MPTFQDHFSRQAKEYAHYRPHYPKALFTYLADLCGTQELAWDCATGNGQAAVELAQRFKQVIATDASAAQISVAEKKVNIDYRVEPAEQSSIADQSIDLITVAQAYHWFDIPIFAKEAERVLKPEGILAVWSYGLCSIDKKVDDFVHHLYHDMLGEFWPAGRTYVDEHYATIQFPFQRIQTPEFYMQTDWNLAQFLGYLSTWSAVQYYKQKHEQDPIVELMPAFIESWGDPEVNKKVTWDIYLLVGKQ